MPLRASTRSSHATAADDWVAVVDDHASLRSSIARAMRIEGIRAEAFGSAEEYLQGTTGRTPCCLVLDLHLPGMSGHELAHHLERERLPIPRVIFISGHADVLESLGDCRIAYGRLGKPFQIDALLALVRPLLRTTAA